VHLKLLLVVVVMLLVMVLVMVMLLLLLKLMVIMKDTITNKNSYSEKLKKASKWMPFLIFIDQK
jgi:hypothetical protein